MDNDDEIFWTYGNKSKKNRRTRQNNATNETVNDNQSDQNSLVQQGAIQQVQQATPEKNQSEIMVKSTRLNPFSEGVDFHQSQKIDRYDDRFSQSVRFNESNILGSSEGRNQSRNSGPGVSFSNNKNDVNQSYQKQQMQSEDKFKGSENFNLTFSPSDKGSAQKQKNQSGVSGMSHTTTSNYVIESTSPVRSSLNNRKPFNTSGKKVKEFSPSPSIYDKKNKDEYKFQRKGQSIWDDLYNNAQALLIKKMDLHEQKLNEKDKECVFQPKLVSNNNKYFNYENNKFLERNEQWKEQRDNKLISQRQNKISVDLKECTFQPTINTTRINTEIPKELELDFVQDNQIFIQYQNKKFNLNNELQFNSNIHFYLYILYLFDIINIFYLKIRVGRAKDASRALSYSKSLYRVAAAQQTPPPYQGYNQQTYNLDIKQTGGIVKSYYIKERERFEKCKKMLSQALKKIPDENIQ